MLALDMADTDTLSPLTGTALGLLGTGASAPELEERCAAAGARLRPGLAEGLLEDLLGLGLVRVARGEGPHRVFVPTSLGARALAGSVAGLGAVSLADLETLRSDLLATIAHELRTPLTAVRTSIGLLTDASSSPTPEQRDTLLATIERNAERMSRLVGDILDLARFRSGSIRLQLRRFDASELARSVAASLGPLAGARGQTIRLETGAHGPFVYGDHRRLEQALVNLVSNALRFSDEGASVSVSVGSDDVSVTWRVVDQGPGIPPDELERLFERFFVGRGDRGSAREGVGLGLPTALAIAQAHGGDIEVASQVGHGSSFGLVVPAAGPPGPPEVE